MASIELKEVPASAWATVGWLGPQVAVIDEQFRVGFWNGSAYAAGGEGGPSDPAVWGAITGTLSAQTDLQAALDAKLATASKATQEQAESGTDNNLWMTALRVAQAIAAMSPSPAWGSIVGSLAAQSDLQAALAAKVNAADVASQVDAEDGTNNTRWMTALRVAQAIEARPLAAVWGAVVGTMADQSDLQTALNAKLAVSLLASQAQAEGGSDNATWMSPLRVAQAIAALQADPTWGSLTGTLSAQSDLQAALDARVGVSDKASQAQAEAGADNATWMTPLRVAQAITIQASRAQWRVADVSAGGHISRILQGADAARRVRPDATYATARWCTPAGAGAKDGTSLANAWGRAELNTALATLTGAHVYLSGTFEPAAYNSAGPLLGPIVGDNVRLDAATYNATLRGYSGLSWTASGVNGEYWAAVDRGQARFRLTEDGERMWVTNAWDAASSRMAVTAMDAGANTLTLTIFKELVVDDPIDWMGGTNYGLTESTAYYVKTATAPSGSPVSQTITLSTTPGGSTVDLTGTLSGSRYMWSLYGGRYGDPVPGSLAAGAAAYSSQEGRIYIKPSWGTPADHVYTFWQTGSSSYLLLIADAAGTCSNAEIIGGDWYGAGAAGIFIGNTSAQGYAAGTKVYGARVRGCEQGIIVSGAADCDLAWNDVSSLSDHALGSKNGVNHEARLKLRYNWARDVARFPSDFGDCQALVTNPSTDDAYITGNVCQRIGHARDFTTYPIGPNDTVNTGTCVVDSSSRVWVTGNYFEECYGEVIEIGPNDVQAVSQLLVAGNVFDQRALEPSIVDVSMTSQTPSSVRVQITSAAGAGFGSDYSNMVDSNLFLLGDVRAMENSAYTIAAMASVRNARTDATKEGRITCRRNVVLLLDPDAPWNIMSLREGGSADVVTGIDSDENVYYSANPNAVGVHIQNDTAAGDDPDTVISLAALGSGAGWTSPDGTVSDKHSTVWDDAALEAQFGAHPTVLRCLLP